MCGIAALFSMHSIEKQNIQKMTDIIIHRGPDAFGHEYFESDKWHLGHRRLSILDVSNAGKQPMSYLDNRYWITYNGEIYNYVELRKELENFGYIFRSNTDTEVIMAAYDYWGKDCLAHFNGMWAFVLLDIVCRKIFVSRDRFGVKPLYYWHSSDGVLAFASEIKQFTVLDGWQAKLNPQRAYDFLVWGQFDHTDETMFSGVYQIRRGEAVELNLDELDSFSEKLTVYSWYKLQCKEFKGSFDEAADEFRNLLIDAVSLRLRSDVQVGSCLSGGLDSSSIVCIINDLLSQSGKSNIQYTVSAGAKVKRYDESEYIDAVLSERKINGYYVYPEFCTLFDMLDDINWHMEEPFGSTSIYAQWQVYKEAHNRGLTVMLDGQGADESLLGYHNSFGVQFAGLFRNMHFIKLLTEIKACTRIHGYGLSFVIKGILSNILPEHGLNKLRRIYSGGGNRPDWINIDGLGIDEISPNIYTGRKTTSLRELSYSELMASNLQRLLHYADRDSMAHSVETRLPFLDYRLVEFILGLPDDYKLSKGVTKNVLRESMTNILPQKVRLRMTKLGFVTPEEVWMRENSEFFTTKLKESIELSNGLLNNNCLRLWNDFLNNNRAFDFKFWEMISFANWMNRFSVKV